MTPSDKPVDEQPEEQAEAKPKAAAKKPAAAKKATAEKASSAEKKPPAAKKPAAVKAPASAKSPEAKKDTEESAQPEPAAPEAVAKKAPARKAKATAKAEATPKSETAAKAESTEPKAEAPAPSARGAARSQASGPPRRKVVSAHARYVRTSARKARMVCGHLRGKSVEEARAILAFTPREVARDWSKLLESAVANAENNHELIEEDLFVREAFADEGPTIKRFRPRAQGRATPIRKRTSHLTITLTPKA